MVCECFRKERVLDQSGRGEAARDVCGQGQYVCEYVDYDEGREGGIIVVLAGGKQSVAWF